MLTITIPSQEGYNEETGTFFTTKEQTIRLEHSLISLSKWEMKWHKPFIDDKPKSYEENLDYIRCMTVDSNVDPSVYNFITADIFSKINDYINDPATATTVNHKGKRPPKRARKTTSELLYCNMITLGIPLECEKWHLNRLLTLIDVCNEENTPSKKMSQKDTLSKYASLNAARRKKH